MAIFMKYDTITGDVTTQGFEKWIAVNSFQWGVGRGIGSATAGSTSRESSTPSISEIVVTKSTDSASVKLVQDGTAGELNHPVTISFTSTTKTETLEFLKYELENVGLSGYSVSSGGDMPSESLSLNFSKVTMTFKGLDPGTQANPQSGGYDLTTQKGF